MLPLVFVLTLVPSLARAAGTSDCAWLMTPAAYLEPDAERAWARLREGLGQLVQPYPVDDWITQIRRHGLVRAARHSGRALIKLPVSEAERLVLCDAVTPLLLETNAAVLDPDLTYYLLDQLCGLAAADLNALTEGVLTKAPGAASRRWLGLVADRIGAAEWRRLLARDPHGTLLEFARTDWARLGLGDDDVLAVARKLAQTGAPAGDIIARTRLDPALAGELAADLDPVQWIELRYTLGQLNETTVAEAERVAYLDPVPARRLDFAHVDRLLLRLLLDEAVPYPVFARVRGLAERLWRRQRNEALPSLTYRAPPKPTAAQLARVEKALGAVVARPAKVWRESRRYARGFEQSLNYVEYTDPEEFIAGFTLSLHTARPTVQADGTLTAREREDTRAVADVYFRRLRRELPRFLSLAPTVDQIRWLLETPTQFAPLALAREVDPRPAWTRRILAEDGTFDTARVITSIQDEALAWAMPRVRTFDEWKALLTARALPALRAEITRRERVARYLYVAARVGPADLSWLADPLLEGARDGGFDAIHTLDRLRHAEPAATRSGQRLARRALRRLRTADQRGRRALLAYLHARSLAGLIVHVPPRRLPALRAIAFTHGYAFDEVARDATSVAFRVIARQRPHRL